MLFNFIHYRILFLSLIFLLILNCQLKDASRTHGILFLENRSNKIQVNKSNTNDIINIIGQPHTKSVENENEWIYIERIFVKGKYHNFGKNILKTNNILYLEFDKYGILKSKRLLNKNDIQKLAFSKDITENNLAKESFLQSFFSSLKSKMYGKK